MSHSGRFALVFALLLALVTFALGEGALRVVQYVTGGVPMTSFLPGYRQTKFQLSPFLVFGPRIDWEVPNRTPSESTYFNDQGFRTRTHVGPKSPTEFRMIALGGSTTEDIWTEDGTHWPLWLERTLRHSHENVRVYNSGMSAYTSAHSLIRLAFDVLDYQPDIVIVMHNVNDLTVNYRAAVASKPVDGHYRVPFADKAFTNVLDEEDVVLSRLWHAVWGRIATPRREIVMPDTYDLSAGLHHFKRNLASMHALAASRGVQLVLLTMPMCQSEEVYRRVERDGRTGASPPMPASFARFQSDFDAYNEAIREVGAQTGASVIDMRVLLEGDDRWFADVVHYNAAGSRRFGELLASQLTPVVDQLRAREEVSSR